MPSYEQLLEENTDLKRQVAEAEETLQALRNGEVDALVVSTNEGNQNFPSQVTDRPYHLLVEEMQEGAVTISIDGTILYCNPFFASLVDSSSNHVVSQQISQYIVSEEHEKFKDFLTTASSEGSIHADFTFQNQSNEHIPVYVSTNLLQLDQVQVICLIVTDLTERNRAQEATRKNEAILSEMGRISRIGAWELNAQTLELIWTKEVYYIHEVDMAYHPTLSEGIAFYAPASRPIIERAIQRAIEHAETFDLELELITAKGNHRWVHALGMAREQYGEVETIFGTFQDFTERKHAEESIHFQAQLLNAVGQAVIATSPDGMVSYWNQFAETLYGWTSEEALNRNIVDLTPTNATRQQAGEIMTYLQNGESWSGEFIVQSKDGVHFPIQVTNTPIWEEEGKQIGMIGVSQDISERKQMEESLAQERTLLRTLIDSLPGNIYAKDTEGRFTLKNVADARQMGAASTDEIIGKTDFDYYPPDLAKQYQADDQLVIQSGQPVINHEEPFVDADGNSGWMLTTKVPLKDDQGTVIGIVGIGRDITEQKQAEERLRQLNRTLALISAVNQAIVRIRSLSGVFAEVCRIAVEIGGFHMAWIGLQDAETGQLNPVAYAGKSRNYPEVLSSLLNDELQIPGPITKALQSGNHVVINDIEQELQPLLWREAALQLGYRASTAFPLVVSGQVRGLLNMYVTQTNFFDASELKLLDEMVADISFAMEFAEQEKMRHEAETALKQYVQTVEGMRIFLQTTLDAFPANTAVIGSDGTIINVNASWINFARMNGSTSPMHYLGDNYLTVCDIVSKGPGSAEVVYIVEGIRAVINGSQDEFYSEYPCHSPSQQRWFALQVTPFPEPAPRRVVIAHLNITVRRQAEFDLKKLNSTLEERVVARTVQLAATKERVETILNSTADAILLLDKDFRIEQTNFVFDDMFAYEHDTYFGKSFHVLLKDYDNDNTNSLLETITETKRVHMEVKARRSNGTVFDADMSIGMVSDDSYVCTFHDISQHKQIEQSLRTTIEKEKELNEMKTNFVSMVSHDFRTPMTIIQTSVDLLQSYNDRMDEERRSNHFNKIKDQIKHMVALLEDMLTISQAESGAMPLSPTWVNLVRVCQGIVDEFDGINNIKHQLRFTHSEGPERLLVDEKLLYRAITNLLSNAFKYSPEDSTVSLDLSFTAEHTIIRVTDQGIGIPEADQMRLFEVFHRAGNVGSIQGTGLGLTIVKRAIEAHGGTLTFDSQIDVGTTFTIQIPINQGSQDSL